MRNDDQMRRRYYYVGPVSPEARDGLPREEIAAMRQAFIAIYNESQRMLDLDPEDESVEPDHAAVCDLISKELKMRASAGQEALLAALGTKDVTVLDSVSDQILTAIPDIYVAYERRK